MFKEKFITKTPTGIELYKNSMTGEYKEHMVYLSKNPNGEETYVVFNDKHEPIYENQRIEDCWFRIDIIKQIQRKG